MHAYRCFLIVLSKSFFECDLTTASGSYRVTPIHRGAGQVTSLWNVNLIAFTLFYDCAGLCLSSAVLGFTHLDV